MSLNKQMLIFITSVLLIVLLGTFTLNFIQTKSYLEKQLESHAQDTATSLGLSLSSVANPDDPSSMNTMINAVFDRGDYSSISLTDMDDKVIYHRSNSIKIEGIPSWFISLIDIEAPTAQALIQTGWIPIGKLSVQSNPDLAYVKLWHNSEALSAWFLFALLLTASLAFYAIRIMLSPLKAMKKQAEAIVKKQYLLQKNLPRTTEFKQVVSAMNTMVHKMKGVFDRDAKMAEKLQKMAYQDTVTGLSNRVHFEMSLEPLLDNNSDAMPGLMAILRVHNLKEINDQYGYMIGDQFMKLLAKKFIKNIDQPLCIAARLNGTELIVTVPNINSEQLINALKPVLEELNSLSDTLNIASNLPQINIGLVDYIPGEKRGFLMAKLDLAINKAQKYSLNSIYYEATETQNNLNNNWLDTVKNALEQKQFVLFQQSSFLNNHDCYAKELLVRLQTEEGQIQSAGYFFPAILKLNKEAELDTLVLEMAIDYLERMSSLSNIKIDINLNPSLFKNPQFIPYLKDRTRNIKPEQLAFEVTEQTLTLNEALCTPVITDLKAMGIQFGIDNFGSHFTNMAYVQKIRPDYIKLDAAFSHAIEKDEQTRSYVSSLIDMCQSLDIDIIACSVETAAQQQAFNDLGIKIYQGYLYGAPKPLESNLNP